MHAPPHADGRFDVHPDWGFTEREPEFLVCTAGPGHPEDRGALFHAVELDISAAGAISGRVIQAFDRTGTSSRRFALAQAPSET